MKMNSIKIFGLSIAKTNNLDLINYIENEISFDRNSLITYVTFNSLNEYYSKKVAMSIYNKFDLIHPDGIGVYFASKLLFGADYFKERFTGSDFYPTLIEAAIQHKWKIFFFGDKLETLEQIPIKNSELNVVGYISGYDFDNDNVVKKVNNAKPNILIIGLGQPRQEKWVIDNKEKLTTNVVIAVGDGIKIFAGTKQRGLKVIQKIGLEWLVRLVYNPKLYWKRYLIGIPLFIFRIIKERIKVR